MGQGQGLTPNLPLTQTLTLTLTLAPTTGSYVRNTIHSANALVGSCRMGAAADPLAVLDPQLRVRG